MKTKLNKSKENDCEHRLALAESTMKELREFIQKLEHERASLKQSLTLSEHRALFAVHYNCILLAANKTLREKLEAMQSLSLMPTAETVTLPGQWREPQNVP